MVLIVVLLVISILAALVLDFGFTARVDLTLAGLNRDAMKARSLVRSGYHLCRALLMRDTNNYDGPGDLWTRTEMLSLAPNFMAEGEQIVGSIVDENSKFNVNSIVDSQGRFVKRNYEQFLRLLEELELPTTLADTLVDWIDPNNEVRSGGAEGNYYQSLGYACKNDFLESARELLLVKDFDGEVLWGTKAKRGLFPYVTTHSDMRININTASEVVLESLDDELDSVLAKSIVDFRNDKPFETTSDLKKVEGIDATIFSRILRKITVSSNFFSFHLESAANKASGRLDVVVERRSGEAKILYWRLQ